MTQQRLPALDGLRGVAAVVVVVFHTLRVNDGFRTGMSEFSASTWADRLVTITPLRVFFDGQLAVWVFFVLSGYVLSRRHWQEQHTRWGSFYLRRAVRLYFPVIASALWAVTLLGIRQKVNGNADGLVRLERIGSSPSLLLHNLTLLSLNRAPLNGVWWSMRWEVWFSILVLPALAVLGWIGCGAKRRFSWTPAVFGLVCVLTVSLVPYLTHTWSPTTVWIRVLLYLPMFGVGMAIAAYESRLVELRVACRGHRGWMMLFVALLCLGMTGPLGWMRVAQILSKVPAQGLSNGFAVFGAGLLVALFVCWPTGVQALSTKAFLWVGARSYSLYLVHLPLLHFATDMFNRSTAHFWYVVSIVAASLVVSAVFYRWVEAPSTRLAARIGRRGTINEQRVPLPAREVASVS